MSLVERADAPGPVAAREPVAAPKRPRWPLLRRLLAVADMLSVGVACAVVALFATPGEAVAAALALPGWILLAKLLGLYDRDQRALRHQTVDELPAIVTWAATGAAVLAVADPTRSAGFLILVLLSAVLASITLRALARVAWRSLTPPERILIVGEPEAARDVAHKLDRFSGLHAETREIRTQISLEELHAPPPWLLESERIIVVGPSSSDEALLAELVAYCRRRQVRLAVVPRLRGLFRAAARLDQLADLPLVEYGTWHVSRSTLALKRALDLVVCGIALVLALPVLAVVALAIRLEDGGPVFFGQLRAGQFGAPFRLLKFRTMVPHATTLLDGLVSFDTLDEPVFKLTDDPRVTRVGRLLRRWSLDELPQLINVLRGQMSLVGPRPEQVELVARYEEEHRFRLAVRPGLTGPMQVHGRGTLSFGERLALDRDYIETLSLRRDLRILAQTVAAVASGRGAY